MSSQLAAMRAYVGAREHAPRAAVGAGGAVVFGSGKGGAGTSVVAALVALSAAAAGRRVLLVDGDEHVGPLSHLLGARPHHGLAELRAGLDVASLVVPVSETLSLVPGGPGQPAAPAPVAPAERRALLRRVAGLYESYELVVIDGGSRLDLVCACCDAAAAGGSPARLVAVTGVDPISLAATYALVKATSARPDVASTGLLVNRADADAAARAFGHADEAARQFLGRALEYAGALPDDGSLDLALRAGMTLHDAAAGSPAAVAAQELATRLLQPTGASSGRAAGAGARVPGPAPLRVMR